MAKKIYNGNVYNIDGTEFMIVGKYTGDYHVQYHDIKNLETGEVGFISRIRLLERDYPLVRKEKI